MSYFRYKPLPKRFKEFMGIVLATAISGFIGVAYAVMQAGDTTFTAESQATSNVISYGFIGAIIGLIVSALVVNTSTKKD